MNLIFNLYVLNILASFIVVVLSEAVHRRFEYKYSFKGPYLAQKDNSVPFWTYSGSAIASEESFRITPSLRSQKGQAWCKNPTTFDWWEVEVVFRVNGRGRIGADGLALWFTASPGVEGPVFGSSDKWAGLGLFFDSFDNDNKRNNPYIMGMVNNGSLAYDHEHDGSSQQLGGCLRDFRNKPFPIRAKIEYYRNILTVKTQQLQFDYSPITPMEDANDIYKALYSTEGPTWEPSQFLKKFDPLREDGQESFLTNTFNFLDGVGRNLLSVEYVDLDQLDDNGQVVSPQDGSPHPKPSRAEGTQANVKGKEASKKRNRRLVKGKKSSKLPKKSAKKDARSTQATGDAVFIHSGMTDNEKDYEICFRTEGVVLPSSGYFGVTAATGGLADDHDVLKYLVHSLRSPQEMAQLRMNKEEEARFQKEFEEYQEKTKKAREDYIAQNPDAAKHEEDYYETSEQRELRQIFQGQAQIFEVMRSLNLKLDDIIGKQDRTLNYASGGQLGPAAGQPVGGQPVATGDISRNEVNALLTNQREVMQNLRDLKASTSDILSKSQVILVNSQKPLGSVQPAGGGAYDFHVTLKELTEGMNIVKRDVSLANQRLGAGGPQAGGVCPQISCVSTSIFVALMVAQIVLMIGYFIYRDSKEAKAKKFY